MISGKIFLRYTGTIKNGKKIFLLCGVIGIDKNNILLNEHQYTITDLKLSDPIDRTEMAKGNTPDGLLKQPIWQI